MGFYRVTVYVGADQEERLSSVLEELKLYWYRCERGFIGEKNVIEYEFYVPEAAVGEVLEKVYSAVDLRRRENGVYIERVEAGRARSRQVLDKRWTSRPLGLKARPVEEILEEARDHSTASILQIALAGIAGIVAVAGIVSSSIPLLIGAMLISPILSPIYAMAVSFSLAKPRLLARSGLSLAMLALAAFTASLLGSLAVRIIGVETRLDAVRATYMPGPLDVLVGVILGLAVSTAALARVNESLTGVAVAAALIPPLAASALGAVYGDTGLFFGAALKALINGVGLIIGSTAAFLILISRLSGHKPRLRGWAVR